MKTGFFLLLFKISLKEDAALCQIIKTFKLTIITLINITITLINMDQNSLSFYASFFSAIEHREKICFENIRL